MNSDNLIDRIKSIIRDKDPDAVAYLFGSRARRDSRPHSDWDNLILVDNKKSQMNLNIKFRNDLYDVELETGQILSTFIYPKGYWNKNLYFCTRTRC